MKPFTNDQMCVICCLIAMVVTVYAVERASVIGYLIAGLYIYWAYKFQQKGST